MRYEAAFLSGAEIERVHEESLRILEEVGVRVHGELALPLLAAAGAGIDAGVGSSLVRLRRALVERALAGAPRSFTFGARNPVFDYTVPSGVTRFAMDGTAAFMRDFETGERRYGRKQDTVDAMRVFQSCDLSVMGWPPVAANDRPVASRPLHEFAAMLTTLSKHGQHELHRRDQAAFLGAMLEALAGSREAARERHLASVVYCPVAPLVHDGEMLDAYIELGSWDVPVTVLPMPVPGTTGPGSLLGNIALANAEALSSVVLFQLAHPGRPVQYGSAVGSMDFRSGAFLAGTPEMGIQSAALTTMGRHYGLPTMAAGCATDAHDIGAEACIEKLLTMLPSISAGADIIVGYGELDGDQTLVLEQILVDNELAHLALRLVAGVDGREGAELFDDIAEVGPGGNFLAQPSTRVASRSGEFYEPSLIGRLPYDAWGTRRSPVDVCAGPGAGAGDPRRAGRGPRGAGGPGADRRDPRPRRRGAGGGLTSEADLGWRPAAGPAPQVRRPRSGAPGPAPQVRRPNYVAFRTPALVAHRGSCRFRHELCTRIADPLHVGIGTGGSATCLGIGHRRRRAAVVCRLWRRMNRRRLRGPRRCVPTMYGTIARLHPQPGRLQDLMAHSARVGALGIAGMHASYLFRPDQNPYDRDTVFLVALFDDAASYQANADSPDQNQRYLEMRELLEDDPEWMDGTFDPV